MKTAFAILVLLTLYTCSLSSSELIILDFEVDLFPEGIAIDSKSGILYLNSLKKNKIVRSYLDGKQSADFIKSDQYGYLSGFGMVIHGDTLFALGNSLPRKNNRSVLLLLNVNNGDLINSYFINDTTFIYLNDIAVDSRSNVYITDSESNRLYTLQNASNELEIFMESDEIAYSNGISISEDDRFLYLASHLNGIRAIDLISKKIVNGVDFSSTGIDGMKYYKNSLIGNVNSKRDNEENGVYRFYLDATGTAIVRREKIIKYEANFKVPTTLAILDDFIYLIINTQLDSFDQESNQVVRDSVLTPYLLMKKKID